MIYENIDKGMYDLSSEKSGIRVGNESYQVSSTPQGGSLGGAKLGKDAKEGKQATAGICC
jgi:hypothetical protein